MLNLMLLPLAAEEGGGAGLWPWLIGGGTLLLLFGALAAVVAFGAGREHS